MKREDNKEYFRNLDHNKLEEAYKLDPLKEPPLYQVLIHNDDFTPMEFVVSILELFFYMDRRKATDTMLEAHMKGRSICGMFSKDFAESKVSQVVEHARSNEHPLICSMEAA